MRVIELRNYLIRDGMTRDFIRYFEEQFLFSQREAGMHVLGQFEVVGAPNRFVWIRGFEDMGARRQGLEGFYGGPFWQARRSEANGMILDSDEVHLLRPLAADAVLTGALALEERAVEPPGAVPSRTGLVAVDFHRAEPGSARSPGRALRASRAARAPGAGAPGARPLRGGPDAQRLSPTCRSSRTRRSSWSCRPIVMPSTGRPCGPRPDGDPWRTVLEEDTPVPLTARVTTMRLRPTARSLVRYRGEEPR